MHADSLYWLDLHTVRKGGEVSKKDFPPSGFQKGSRKYFCKMPPAKLKKFNRQLATLRKWIKANVKPCAKCGRIACGEPPLPWL
jgi:hypothetical protein